MNEIIAAIILFGIITAVFAPLILESGSQIFSRSSSISDVMESSRIQSGQIMIPTNIQQVDGSITAYLSNIGVEDIRIRTVLIDGIESGFVFHQNSVQTDLFRADRLGVLEVAGTGDSVQIIASSGKLFEFHVP